MASLNNSLSTGFTPQKTVDIAKLLLREPEMGRLVKSGLVNPRDLDTPAKVARARARLTITKERDAIAGGPTRRQQALPGGTDRTTESRVVVQPSIKWYAPPSRSYTNA